MKKMSKRTLLGILPVALSAIIFLCGIFMFGYINGSNGINPVLVSSFATDGLSALKQEKKDELNQFVTDNAPVNPATDWADVYARLTIEEGNIDAAATTGEVESAFLTAKTMLDGLIKLEKYRITTITGERFIYPANTIFKANYEAVKTHYAQLIKVADSIGDINALANEAVAKYDAIEDYEAEANSYITDINSHESAEESLNDYTNLINPIKADHVDQIKAITGAPAADANVADFSSGYAALKAQFSPIFDAFVIEFDALMGNLTAHNNLITQSVADTYINETVATVFGGDSSQSVADQLTAAGLTEAEINRANTINSTYINNVNALRSVDSLADLDNAADEITTLKAAHEQDLAALKADVAAARAQDAADKAEAERVDALINGLSENSSYDEVIEVRQEYSRLTANQKSKVTKLERLEELEQLKRDESPLIAWGIVLIIFGIIFVIELGAFIFIIISRKKNARS